MPSLEDFKAHVKKAQRNLMQKIDKYSNKVKPILKPGETQPQTPKPIYEVVHYDQQQTLLAFCMEKMFTYYGREKLKLSPKILVSQDVLISNIGDCSHVLQKVLFGLEYIRV